MAEGPNIAQVSSLIGDPARANMMMALLAGQALTAGELANEAHITAQTASSHLAKLEEGGLVYRHRQGRHHYFSIAGAEIACLIESLIDFSANDGRIPARHGPREAALREARVCYDHLAGAMAVRLLDQFVARDFIREIDHNLLLNDEGASFFADFAIDVTAFKKSKRPLCRACLDWSERRRHLAGHLGAALFDRFRTLGWARQKRGSRLVTFTPKGLSEIRVWSGLSI